MKNSGLVLITGHYFVFNRQHDHDTDEISRMTMPMHSSSSYIDDANTNDYFFALLRVEYNGRNYGGWQRQGKIGANVVRLSSVQATLEGALSQLCCSSSEGVVCVQVSGRTDKGTHALDQQCAFRLPNQRFLNDAFLSNLNQILQPKEIHVLDCVSVPSNLRQIFVKKRYVYLIHQPNTCITTALRNSGANNKQEHGIPLLRHYSWYVPKKLNVEAIRVALSYFHGTHDFQYVSNEAKRTNTIRTISKSMIHKVIDFKTELPMFQNLANLDIGNDTAKDEFLVIEFEANGFLQHQVRRMVAILRLIGEGTWDPDMVHSILQGMEYKVPASAPSRGLYLSKVWRQGEEGSTIT